MKCRTSLRLSGVDSEIRTCSRVRRLSQLRAEAKKKVGAISRMSCIAVSCRSGMQSVPCSAMAAATENE